MTNKKDILDGYFKSAKQEKVDISLTDVNSILNQSIASTKTGLSSAESIVGKTFIKLKYIIISSATVMSIVVWLFVLTSNSEIKTKKNTLEKKEINQTKKVQNNNQNNNQIKAYNQKQQSIKECKVTKPSIRDEIQHKREINRTEISSNCDDMPQSEQLISAALLKEDRSHIVTLPDEHIDLPPEHDDVLLNDEAKLASDKKSKKSQFKSWKSHGSNASAQQKVYNYGIFGLRKLRVYLVNSKNKTVYNDISNLTYNRNKWAKVLKNKKYGFIDKEGNEVVKLQYDRIYLYRQFDKTWAKVVKNKLEGFIDTLGQEIVEPAYQKIYYFDEYREGWAQVKRNEKYGFINEKGKEIVKPIYDEIKTFGLYQESWALVKENGKYGFINDDGEEILAPTYDRIFYFDSYQESWAQVKKNGKYGFINDRAKEIVEPKYDKVFYFDEYKENWALVYLDKKYGFIDNKGKTIVPLIYNKINAFGVYKEDWALVKKDGKYGFIDDKGKQIVPAIYDHVGYFGVYKENWMKVTKDGLESFINEKGVEVVSFRKHFYDASMQYEFKDEKLIIKNKKGEIINGDGESIDLLEKRSEKK